MNYAVFNSDSYVWKTLDVGYVQGMCDLVAPLLVIFDSGKLFDSGILHCHITNDIKLTWMCVIISVKCCLSANLHENMLKY